MRKVYITPSIEVIEINNVMPLCSSPSEIKRVEDPGQEITDEVDVCSNSWSGGLGMEED